MLRFRLLTACALIALAGSPARADPALPAHVFGLAEIQSARAQAQRQGKVLALVVADEKAANAATMAATRDAFRTLRNSAVLVYADRTELNRVPLRLQVAQASARDGKELPKVIVIALDLRQVIAVVPFAPQPRRARLLAQALALIQRHAGRTKPRVDLQHQASRRVVQPVGQGHPSPAGTPVRLDAPRRPRPRADAPVSAETKFRPVVELSWEGELAPSPADTLGAFFRAQGIPMRARCRASSCRFDASAPVAAEAFKTELQILLNRHYQVTQIRIRAHRVTAVLAPTEPADQDADQSAAEVAPTPQP